ncbi:hypothetical protein ABIA32_006597 [Streptacidiphilus sp. MAP12-20]|uniref:hypothetical protein n=1 Tax=Streptacidiphilus sp. MAP12-20 TaxID=3156299 RepID=UPI003511FCED
MTLFLIKSDLGTLEDGIPNPDAIRKLIDSIAAGELSFLVIQQVQSPQIYIQAFLDIEGVCLEHREGGPERHYSSRGVTVEQAHAAMMSWASGTEDWRSGVTWQRAQI